MELTAGLRTYKCTYTIDDTVYGKFISAESEAQAGELFDQWADQFSEWPQLIKVEEAK